VVLPRIRPLLVRRLGPKVVVEYAGTVVRTVAQPVVVTSVQSLEKVPASDFSKSTAGKVLKVSEDFTVVVDVQGQKTPVRLIGLEPADAEQAPPLYRREAQRFFQNLLAGEFVYLESDPGVAEKDEAGNTAAYLYRAPDGLLVNLEAVRQGYAVASDYTCKHEKLFNFYEAKAQADGKGIWAPPPATRPADRPRPPARMERAVPPAPER
jgi:endonuclease YncB( thermonuclease family)